MTSAAYFPLPGENADPPAGPRRVGIFGGSFDPPHRAHLALAQAALRVLALDELRWIPAGQPWQKSSRAITAAAHREAMVRLTMAGEPRFVLDRCELLRQGPSYTLDTVKALQGHAQAQEAAQQTAPHSQWFLLIGQDQLAGLHTWHGWQELLGRVATARVTRPGVTQAPDPEVQRLTSLALPLPMMDLSSTAIRARIACGEPIDDLVLPAVARYIDHHHLYHPTPPQEAKR